MYFAKFVKLAKIPKSTKFREIVCNKEIPSEQRLRTDLIDDEGFQRGLSAANKPTVLKLSLNVK